MKMLLLLTFTGLPIGFCYWRLGEIPPQVGRRQTILKTREDTMKMRLLLAFTALAIGFAVPVLAQEKNTIDPAVRQQIKAVNMKYDEAYNKGDAAAIVARYTQDAVEVWGWASGGVASGWQAIEERYKIRFAATASTPGTLSRKLVQAYAIGNDICAISEFSHVYRQGSKGYSVTIYVREGDDWKIRMDYAN